MREIRTYGSGREGDRATTPLPTSAGRLAQDFSPVPRSARPPQRESQPAKRCRNQTHEIETAK